ncbi:MAG: divergent polysaccharide deacetylase family protein [bacterium]
MTTRRKSRSSTGRDKQTRRRGTGGRRAWRWLLAGCLLLIIGGLGLLAWSRTPAGHAVLLRLGATRFYPDVQAAIDAVVAEVLPAYVPGPIRGDIPDDATAIAAFDWPVPALGPTAVQYCRLVPLPDEVTFWEVQSRLHDALKTSGGSLLWGERLVRPGDRTRELQPDETSDLLRLDLGVPGHPTHVLVLYKASQRAPSIRWGTGREASAWMTLRQQALDKPVVAIVIDDWGYFDNHITNQLLAMPAPLTLAVMPGLSFSRKFALEASELAVPANRPSPGGDESAHGGLRRQRLERGCVVDFRLGRASAFLPQRRREVILHLPMEPEGYPDVNPGSGAILVGMNREEIARQIEAALKALPGVTGISSHMGSRATADQVTMASVMQILAREELFFLDSLTSPKSVAVAEAVRAGIPALRSRIFLDQDWIDQQQIRRNLTRLVEVARATGFAVGIGHPHGETAAVLAAEIPRWQQEGVCFVTLSEMLSLQEQKTVVEIP